MTREPAPFPCAPRCDLASTWLTEQVELRPDGASLAGRLEITGVDQHIRLARTASQSWKFAWTAPLPAWRAGMSFPLQPEAIGFVGVPPPPGAFFLNLF